MGVHPSGSVVRGPAVRPVQCPVRPVSSHLGSSSGIWRPAVWCPPVRCPAVWGRPRPSGRVRLVPIRRWHWGQADAARQPAPRERAQVPVGCRVVERLGPTAEQARPRATPPRSPMVGGAVGGGPGPGRAWAAAVLDAGLPGRPGGVRSARRRRLREGTGGGCTGREAAVPGMGGRPLCVVIEAPGAHVDGPGGADGLAGGDGRAAPARPRQPASAPGLLPTAL
jgi:hypothetical protein